VPMPTAAGRSGEGLRRRTGGRSAVGIGMGGVRRASGPATSFVERHPTVKMLVFSFLLLIGMTLMADGFGMHVPKGYIYAAIGFSTGVELLNQLATRRRRLRGAGVGAPNPVLPDGAASHDP